MPSPAFPVTGDVEADQLISTDPFARLIGMLLDQQVTMESAFKAPYRLRERLGGVLDPETIANWDPDDFDERFRIKPALHRFPAAMSKRVRTLSHQIVDDYDGDASRIWTEAADGADLLVRLRALPGFGEEKARIYVAVLAKRFSIKPDGWEAAAGPFADAQPRSVADIDSRESFDRVRVWKKQQKAKGLAKGE